MIKECTLGDCVETIIDYRGKTPQKMGGDWADIGYRVVSALNVHDGFIDNEDQIRCVSQEIYDKWMKDEIKRNDCFLASEGASLGENTIWDSDEKIVLGQRLYAIRTNSDKLDPWYFAMYMQTKKFRQQINQISTGSTVFGISQPTLLGVKLLLPNIVEQRKIGALYRNIYRKIKNNISICSDLESIAKTIYNYWFLQFEFPNEDGKLYKSSGGKMVWNEELKREIPDGWLVRNISDLCALGNGINYDKKATGDKTYKIVNVRDISASSLLINKQDMNEISLPSTLANKYLVNKNDILIARSGTPGAVRLVLDTDNVIYCGFIIHCLPNDFEHRFYLTFTLKLYEGTSATKTGGSILQNVSQDTLKSLTIPLPSKNVLSSFNAKIKPLIDKMQLCIEENNQLASLRDFLLPMLMNGQVTFKEVDE